MRKNLKLDIRISILSLLLVLLNTVYNYSQESANLDIEIAAADNFKRDALNALKSKHYDTAIYYYKKAIILYTDLGDLDNSTKCHLNISDVFYAMGIYDSAYFYALVAKSSVSKKTLTDSSLTASIYYTFGSLFIRLNEVDSAEYYLNESLDYCKNGLNDSIYSLVNKAIGNINFSQQNFQEAHRFYLESLQSEMKRANPSDALIASLYQNMGIIMAATGLSDSAKHYLLTSISLKERIYTPNDPQLAKGYLNIGRFLQVQGDLLEALSYQDKAENIYHENFGNDYAGLAPIYWNKGAIYIILNDYDRALTYHEQALDIYLKQLDPKHYIISEIYLNIGLLYNTSREYQLAIEYFSKGINDNLSPESYVKANRNIANSYFGLEEYEKAEEYYKLSINESERHFGNDHYITGNSFANFGIFCNNIGRNNEAEKYLTDAFRILSDYFGLKNRNVSDILVSIGDLNRSERRYILALESYQKALVSYIDSFDDESIYSNPSIENIDLDINIFKTLNMKANTFLDIYNYSNKDTENLYASLETILLAIDLFESIMSSYKDEKTKIIINDLNYGIYDLAVIIATELYAKTMDKEYLSLAFEFSEKGKSAVLLSSLRELEAKEVGSIPENIRVFEENLNRELSVYKNYVSDESQKSEPDSSKMAYWKRVIFDKTLAYDSLISSIENNYPEYFNLKYSNEVITLEQIQRQLVGNRAFIEYKMTDSLLMVFFVSKDTTILNSRKLEKDFKDKVINYVSALNKFPEVSNTTVSLNDFVNKSQYLYDILLDEYFPLDNYSSLIIVPDDVLGYLSFETLISSRDTSKRTKFRDLEYLIQSHSVAYSYSGTLLFQHLLKKKQQKSNYLAMAPSYSNVENAVGNSYANLRDIEKFLIPLQYTMQEVTNIGNVFSGKVLLEDEATEANFKKYASNYGILHFAMHALINDEDPLASKLIFTLNNDTLEDGFLNTYEIYDLKLNADLAVLSACKTGVGKLSRGEGIMSLARGFLYAGVPGIVMTLWEVEDVSSVNIMNEFYRNLKNGLPKDIALRNSKLEYLNNSNQLQSHPYFWGAFVQIGDNSPIIPSKFPKYLLIISIAFLLIASLLTYRIIKIKRNHKLNR